MTPESTGGPGVPPFMPASAPGVRPAASPAAPTTPTRAPYERRFATPRRVRHGLKLRTKLPFQAKSAFARHWMSLIEAAIPSPRVIEGAEYARLGQTVSLSVGETQPGTIEAQVQGTSPRPYTTRIHLRALTPEQWSRVVDAMSHEAMHVAKLLANELPPSIDEVFRNADAILLPAVIDADRFECDCREDKPCKHAAAIAMLVAEHFDNEPLSVFMLLGMAPDKLLDRIRHARAVQDHDTPSAASIDSASAGADGAGDQNGKSPATLNAERRAGAPIGDPMIPESQVEPTPLEQCLDEYWRPGPRLAELESRPPRPHVPHALLRRLGPSPLNGKFPLVGLLASIYDAVGAQARKLREQDDEAAGDQPGAGE
jgi:uncharacterized Zn finger protein